MATQAYDGQRSFRDVDLDEIAVLHQGDRPAVRRFRRAPVTTATAPHPVDYRQLMKKVERVVAAIEQADDLCDTVHSSVD